jgi:protein-tyrosine phosphatase
MSMGALEKWSPEQQQRLNDFSTQRAADIHCHCLPGFDDGPATLEDSLALCQALVKDGITSVIATPHQLGRYDRANSVEQVRRSVEELSAELKDREIPLELFPGGDVRIDERLPDLIESGEIGTAADARRHLLLELPHDIFVDALPIIGHLRELGIQTILTHPERHHYLHNRDHWARDCLELGAVLQITAGSLLGEFGGRAYEAAWRLIRAGMVGIVASDAHDTLRRPPRMTEAIRLLTLNIGREATRSLTIENPLRVLAGQPIEPGETC